MESRYDARVNLAQLLIVAATSFTPVGLEGGAYIPADTVFADSVMAADSLAAAPEPGLSSAPDTVTVAIAPAPPAQAGGARSIPGRAMRGALNFASDAWYVVSSPARINRRGAIVLGIVVAAGGAVYANDEEILAASDRNHDSPIWRDIKEVGTFVEPTGWMAKTIPFHVAACVAGYAFDVRPLREIPLQVIESHLISGGIRNSFKLFAGRRRPFENKGPYFYEFNGGTSLPSGHTSTMFELATVLAHHSHSKLAGVALYALATAGAVERIQSRSHWPSDVFLSAIAGTLVARTVIHRHEERAAKAHVGFFIDGGGTPRVGVTVPLR